MMVLPYTLQYYGTGTDGTDISDKVISIDKFTDVGTGEIVSAKVMLDALYGDFVTESNSGDTPIISQYDLFKLEITDDADNSYSRYLIQDNRSPQKNDDGSFLVLELFGRERYLQKMYFPGHFYFISFRDMIVTIRDFYNANRGSNQPSIRVSATDVNTIPKHTYGIFEFGEETTVYDALMEVVKRLSLPVAAGGAGQFFGLTFSDVSESSMFMRIRAQGSLPSDPITLEKPITLTELKQPSQGNIVVVKGQQGSGSYPKEPALWRSLVEEFDNLPLWDDTIQYEKDAYVRYNDVIYQAKNNHSAANILPTVTASWSVTKFKDYIKNYTGSSDFQYSPLTQDKQAVWRNRCANAGGDTSDSDDDNYGNSFLVNDLPDDTTPAFDALCVTDGNLVIRDRNAWRDWVDFRVASLSDIPTEYLYEATTDANTLQKRTYHGLRVLVDPAKGTITAPFTGNDKLGHAYENSLVMQDRDGDWIVFRNAEQFDECSVISEEGRIYEYNLPLGTGGVNNNRATRNVTVSNSSLSWRNTSEVLLGNDCFHYPTVFENTDGLIGEDDTSIVTLDKSDTEDYTDNSGIKIEYEFNESSTVEDAIRQILHHNYIGLAITLLNAAGDALLDFTSEVESKLYDIEIYNIGWWATLWEAPDPKCTFNGITEDMGELFGGDADNKRPVLDLLNLNQTPTGKTGYGNTDSDLLGPIDGIKLLFNFDVSGIDINTFRGDMPFRCIIYDLLGNVWVSDTTHRFQGDTYEMDFPLSSFRIYRARIQPGFTLSNAISRIINPELKITEIFERRLVKRINLQCMASYDDEGRYDPINWEAFLRKVATVVTGTTVKYTGIIDAFHFTKTPIAIARDTVDNTNSVDHRHLMVPIKKYPGISNVVQLQKIADSELAIAKHQHDMWTAKYEDRADISAEHSVYMRDSDFISETDKTGTENTRKMIVKKITYSVGDRNNNSGLITTVDIFRQVAT